MKFNIKKHDCSEKKGSDFLNKITMSAYNIDGDTFSKYYVEAGGDRDIAEHVWKKWKVEHKDNFLWAYGNLDKENRTLVTKVLMRYAKERGY
jgi:hypothetical protein